MKRPVILITGGPAYDPLFRKPSRMLNKTYTAAVTAAGGIPVMDLYEDAFEDYIALADGCIFTGTHEFTPDAKLSLYPMQVERITREHKMMRAFMQSGKPIFAICQGFQQFNTALGGEIEGDFRLKLGVEHNRTVHTVALKEGSLLHRLYGNEMTVNSLHNVRVTTLAPDLIPTAISPDGVVEAFEHKSYPVFGFQFHPERMRGDFPTPPIAPNTDPLFDELITMCQKK